MIAMCITKPQPRPQLLSELRRVRQAVLAAGAESDLIWEWNALARLAWRSPDPDVLVLGEVALGYSDLSTREEGECEFTQLREASVAELLCAVERAGKARPDLG